MDFIVKSFLELWVLLNSIFMTDFPLMSFAFPESPSCCLVLKAHFRPALIDNNFLNAILFLWAKESLFPPSPPLDAKTGILKEFTSIA